MAYQFKTKLEFSREALGFLATEDRFAEVGGRTYLKAGPAGLPADLAGSVGVVLVLRDRSAVGRDGAGGSWKAACSYDVGALSPIEGYEYSAYDGLFGPGRSYEVAELVYARSKEVDAICSRVARDAARAAWDEAEGKSDLEADREACFGHRERYPLVTRAALEKWYLAHRTLERDFSEDVYVPPAAGDERLRAVCCRDALVSELAARAAESVSPRTRVMAAEWSELAEAEGEGVVRDCARNAELLDCLDALDARNVKAVFDEGGQEVEHAMPASALSRAARDGSGLLLWGGFFTPRLNRSPDMASFLGVKYRGKWVYRVA